MPWLWAVRVRGPQGMLALLLGDAQSATVGMHWHDDADTVFLFPPS